MVGWIFVKKRGKKNSIGVGLAWHVSSWKQPPKNTVYNAFTLMSLKLSFGKLLTCCKRILGGNGWLDNFLWQYLNYLRVVRFFHSICGTCKPCAWVSSTLLADQLRETQVQAMFLHVFSMSLCFLATANGFMPTVHSMFMSTWTVSKRAVS